jgi:hypothetical protein
MSTRSEKAVYWVKLLSKFVSVQLIVQALGFASGVLIIRTLSKEEYAYFTIANSLQATMNLLADSGVSTGLISIGGKVWQDSYRFGQLINTAIQLRIYFLAISVMIVTPVLLWMLLTNGSSLFNAILIIIAILIELYFYLINAVLGIVLRLHSDIKKIQYLDLLFSTSRLTLLGIAYFGFLNAAIAAFISTLSTFFQTLFLKKNTTNEIDTNAPISIEDRKVILTITRSLLPSTIYYCIQGQLSIFLISVFGNTTNIAEIGALGRLSVVFTLLNSVMTQIFIPSFARCPPRLLLRRYIQIVGGYSIIGLIIVALVILFPKQILWIIGKNYAHLQHELLLMIASTLASAVVGLMWSLNSARAWIKYSWLYVPATLIMQIFLLVQLDLSTVSGVIYFGLLSVLPFLLINLSLTYMGISSTNNLK